MPPKRMTKRTSPPEDAVLKSKKAKSKLASILVLGGFSKPPKSGTGLLPPDI